ncbi:MAG TPA: 16S rRNA (cytosine(1402)-N(4))-methyltransferase RsmH [Candidatus Binatia bacterium]|nr:16S rRNA (cytosine(1402)-N(4))-methyltransferase RsmH [Candidatus Binatia bacterium]
MTTGRVTEPVIEGSFAHISVLSREVGEWLRPEPGKRYLDGTLGGGGHAEEILIRSSPDGQVLGLDRDGEAIAAATKRLQRFGKRLVARQASFADATSIMGEIGWSGADGVVLDLGISSHQIDSPERGFSFRGEAPLDMRMDRRQALSARELLNTSSADELEQIFRDYGEEPDARRIARAVVAERQRAAIHMTGELVKIVESVKRRKRRDHHAATQVFQALRIAVNQELQHLEKFMDAGFELLLPGARLAVISFHSLEDRIVKRAFRKWSRSCLCPPRVLRCQCGWSQKVKMLSKKPIVPSANEITENPRARSAKLRVVERV